MGSRKVEDHTFAIKIKYVEMRASRLNVTPICFNGRKRRRYYMSRMSRSELHDSNVARNHVFKSRDFLEH